GGASLLVGGAAGPGGAGTHRGATRGGHARAHPPAAGRRRAPRNPRLARRGRARGLRAPRAPRRGGGLAAHEEAPRGCGAAELSAASERGKRGGRGEGAGLERREAPGRARVVKDVGGGGEVDAQDGRALRRQERAGVEEGEAGEAADHALVRVAADDVGD